jgi:hypothetical protein
LSGRVERPGCFCFSGNADHQKSFPIGRPLFDAGRHLPAWHAAAIERSFESYLWVQPCLAIGMGGYAQAAINSPEIEDDNQLIS